MSTTSPSRRLVRCRYCGWQTPWGRYVMTIDGTPYISYALLLYHIEQEHPKEWEVLRLWLDR